MGGAGALKIAMANPELFSAIACLSPALFISEMVQAGLSSPWSAAYSKDEPLSSTIENPYWQTKMVMEKHIDYPALYLCCGTEDELCYPCSRRFCKYLDQIGMKYTYHEQQGSHDWEFWNDEIKRIFAWLPLKNDLVSLDNHISK